MKGLILDPGFVFFFSPPMGKLQLEPARKAGVFGCHVFFFLREEIKKTTTRAAFIITNPNAQLHLKHGC